MVKDVVLKIRRVNQLGDQQQQVLLSEFEFPTDEIVILDNQVIDSEVKLRNSIEHGDGNSIDILIIPKIRGG
ncbi:MAG: hypothetical protein ACTSR3_18310 [Candidatus Helarchaeota archaeon]